MTRGSEAAGQARRDRQAEAPNEVEVSRPSDALAAKQAFTSLLLGLGGVALLVCGVSGLILGLGVTTGYALSQGWPPIVPGWASGLGLAATVLIGAVAGLYPAVRASRLPPARALAAH